MKTVRALLSLLFVALLASSKVAAADTLSVGPVETLESIQKGLSANPPHVQVLWTTLPASYQKDVRSLISDYADKIDPKLWDASFRLIGKAAKVCREKLDYILASEDLAKLREMPGVNAAYFSEPEHWELLISLVETIAKSDIATHAGLKKLDPEKFLATTGNKVAEACIKLAMAAGGDDAKKAEHEWELFRHGKFTLAHEDDHSATVKFEIEGKDANEIRLVKVEGKWVFAEMADQFEKAIAEAKAASAQVEVVSQQSEQFLQVAAVIETGLDELLAANSKEEFEAIGQRLAAQIGGMAGAPPSTDAEVNVKAPEATEVAAEEEENEEEEHENEEESEEEESTR